MKILIKDVLLNAKTRDIHPNNGKIEKIAERCGHNADKVISGNDKTSPPSFINGHTHVAMTFFADTQTICRSRTDSKKRYGSWNQN